MVWKKATKPKRNLVTIRYDDDELSAIKELMKKELISKQEAARRLAFPAGEEAQ